MGDATNDPREWTIIEIAEPIEGLAELYEHDRALYTDAIAERILGRAGRMIAGSKTGYSRANPTNVPVFNANVCTRKRGKIWFGDLDLTEDEPQLAELASELGESLYVLFERAARFGNDKTPELHDFVLKVESDGETTRPDWIIRDEDGRLRRGVRNG